VRAALRRLLPILDFDTTTERMVRERVSQELGNLPVEAHKKLIKVGVGRVASVGRRWAKAQGSVRAERA
jgi:hypothetical protein